MRPGAPWVAFRPWMSDGGSGILSKEDVVALAVGGALPARHRSSRWVGWVGGWVQWVCLGGTPPHAVQVGTARRRVRPRRNRLHLLLQWESKRRECSRGSEERLRAPPMALHRAPLLCPQVGAGVLDSAGRHLAAHALPQGRRAGAHRPHHQGRRCVQAY